MKKSKLLLGLLAVAAAMAVTATTVGLRVLAPEAASEAENKTVTAKPDAASEKAWVDSVFNTMTPRQRVAQLFVPRLDAQDTKIWHTRIRQLVEKDGVGGLLFGKGTIESYRNLINYARSVARVPLMITLDGEWGPSMNVKDATRFPHTMGLGAIRDPKLLYEYGLETARECKALGINVDFAPVLDVNSNPANPVIGYRSFGEDPKRVAELGVQYSKGMEDGGVISCAKHFPGHGDTSSDSHKTLPTVSHSRALLDSVDLVPFKAYADAGLSAVMVGHLKVPALDPSGTPTSLSKKVSTDLLKGTMGFKGLVFTDALAMKGANSSENNCIRAFNAGADLLLGSAHPEKDIEAFWKAVQSGKISQAEVDARVKKILAYKYRFDMRENRQITAKNLKDVVNNAQADAVNRKLCAASITCVRNDADLLPLKKLDERTVAVVSLGAPADNRFSEYCAKYTTVAKFGAPSGSLSEKDYAALKKYNTVIVGIFSDKAAERNSYARLAKMDGVVPVFFVNAYKSAKFAIDHAPTLLFAYDDTPMLQEYAAQAVFGGIQVDGQLPVNLKGVAKMGAGVVLPKTRLGYSSPALVGVDPGILHAMDSIAMEAINARAVPGIQLLIARRGEVIVDKSWGTTDYVSNIPVTSETIYDLASVSKTTGTLPGIMKAYDEGLFGLDDPAVKYIPGLEGQGKDDITIRELLFHETGMPAALNMFTTMMDPETYEGDVLSSKRSDLYSIKVQDGVYGNNTARLRSDLVSSKKGNGYTVQVGDSLWERPEAFDTIMARIYKIGRAPTKNHVYSCLNFSLLMDLEQRVTTERHDNFVRSEIYSPLGANTLGYRPTEYYPLEKIAPTEKDNYLRRQVVHGFVHDEMADFGGGIFGNAGLFGNAEDLAKLCQMWLNGGTYGGDTLLSPETVKLFTTTVSPTCNRGLGFDKWDVNNGKTRTGATKATYGHTGFTGTAFWVDPDNDLIFIFLSNRVHPTRDSKVYNRLSPRNNMQRTMYRFVDGPNLL